MEPRGIAETDPKNKAVGTKTGKEVTAGHVLNTYPHRSKVEIPELWRTVFSTTY
jgi:hypothetical protein